MTSRFFIYDDNTKHHEVIVSDNTKLDISDQNNESDNSTYTDVNEHDETYESLQEMDLSNIDTSNINLRPRKSHVFRQM